MRIPTNLPDAPPTDDGTALDRDWLGAALAHLDAGTIAGISPQRVGTGQMGQSWRIGIDWSEPARAHAAGAPTSVVAKIAGGDPSTRALISSGYRAEFVWYTELAPTVAISVPRCWYATITDDSTSFVLLLDDLAPDEPGAQVPGITTDVARVALGEMAGLHGPRWADPSLLDIEVLRPPTAEGAEFHAQIYAGAVPRFVEQFGRWMTDDDVAVVEDFGTWLAAWNMVGTDRLTIVHGDFRPDNLMIAPDGSRVTTLDWQTAGLGFGGRDVGYLLGLGLDTELRRAHERDLVTAYHDALAGHGVDRSFDETFTDYRLGCAQGLHVTVLGAVYATAVPTEASNAMFASMITRSCATVRDLDPRSLL